MGTRKYLLSPIVFLLLSSIFYIAAAKFVVRLRADTQCPTAGYFRDETNCRKFYRCAEHPTGVPGQNYISKSEFNCPPGTIFDEVISGCNHIMFVHNIPPGCDVSEANPGGISGGGSGSHNNNNGSPSSANPPATSSPTVPTISAASTTTRPPFSFQLGQHPQLPLMPPENVQLIPTFPGTGDHQQQPMLPEINNPMLPGSGNGDQQQPPMFPSINFPMMPGSGGDQQQPPMFPSINFPMMPGASGDQQQQPMFPSINFPMLPGNQGQQPIIPSPSNPPSVPAAGQQQLTPFNPQSIQLFIPSNLNISGISMFPNAQHTQQQHNQNVYHEQNLQNLAGSSMPSTSITITAQNSQNKPSSQPSWVNPPQFHEQTVVKPHDISSGGWVVPSNFPTFYSAFGRSPILLSTSLVG